MTSLGYPFRDIHLAPAALLENGKIQDLARAIYDDRRFDALPVLGDALEEAGCRQAKVLDHCRKTTGHVRGCWVVDRVLGKE